MSKRSEAALNNETTYFTGTPCKYGHYSRRRTNNGHCIECESVALKTPKWKAYRKQHYLNNKEKVLEQTRQYQRENRGRLDVAAKAWINNNRDKKRGTDKKWRKTHPEKHKAKLAAYRAKKLQAMPSWVDKKEIQNVYRDCTRTTAQTGIAHQVDHIIPLRHKKVCGLHVPWNLQIITAHENAVKKNTFRTAK